MDDLAEKRVYGARAGATQLAVAAAPGLAVVAVAEDRVGEFGIARRCSPADVAAAPDAAADGPRVAVATDEAVLLGRDVDGLEPAGFGPAVAVTFDGPRPVAAAPGGRLAVADGTSWVTVAELDAPPTALDGDLVGTDDGVQRLVDGTLRPAGLVRVTDVARAGGIPLAATASGLFALGNGWLDVLDGAIRLVAGAPDGRAHAVTDNAFVERVDGEWRPVDLPVDDPVAAVAYGALTYAVTAAGELLVEAGDDWRAHPLGLDGVRAAAVL